MSEGQSKHRGRGMRFEVGTQRASSILVTFHVLDLEMSTVVHFVTLPKDVHVCMDTQTHWYICIHLYYFI